MAGREGKPGHAGEKMGAVGRGPRELRRATDACVLPFRQVGPGRRCGVGGPSVITAYALDCSVHSIPCSNASLERLRATGAARLSGSALAVRRLPCLGPSAAAISLGRVTCPGAIPGL